MFEIILTSKKSNRVIKGFYTAKQLLESDEIDIVMEMTKCDCQPVGETNFIECDCPDEWDNYDFVIGEHTEVEKLREELSISKIRQMELITDISSEKNSKNEYIKTVHVVNEENKKLRKVLNYYADETKYKDEIDLDKGSKAREALLF